jgi:hypothetical protein
VRHATATEGNLSTGSEQLNMETVKRYSRFLEGQAAIERATTHEVRPTPVSEVIELLVFGARLESWPPTNGC